MGFRPQIMKILILLILLGFCLRLDAQVSQPAAGAIYNPNEVAKVEVFIDADSLAFILDPQNSSSNHDFRASLIFTNNSFSDTINDIGFRLRGNTSRSAAKKSFKISFNSFASGRRYQGLKDLNLYGEHNDPSISRARICWDFAKAEGIAASRVAHAELYVNGIYKGLYLNIEHINNDWLSLRFGSSTGNLYKCTYPADLRYISNNPNDYKLTKNNGERVYELKTNESTDDYSKLAEFINVLNNSPLSQLACALDSIFNVETYLQTLAFEVIMGHWDNYSFNRNNYYLYDNPKTEKLEYIPYDIDNSMGVDWFGIDWATRDVNNWQNASENMPLSDRLLSVPALNEIYQYYLRFYSQKAGNISLAHHIDSIKNLINSAAYQDTFKSLDYGFSNTDFDQSFTTNQGNMHVKKGIKPYLSIRSTSAINQLGIFNIAPIIINPDADFISLPGLILFKALVKDENLSTVSCNYKTNGGSLQNIVLSDDGQHNDGDANDGLFAASISATNVARLSFQINATDSLNQVRDRPCSFKNISIVPSGPLVINEFMADNDNTIPDNNGNYKDWIEIYNNSSDSIFLGYYFLTDKATTPLKWRLPPKYLASGDFVIYWASNDTTAGPNHTNFGLSKGGEEIGLFKIVNGQAVSADRIIFGAQSMDISYGRSYDASPTWQAFTVPSPDASNGKLGLNHLEWDNVVDLFPNPYTSLFNIRNKSNKPLDYQIFDAFGRPLQEGKIEKNLSQEITDNAAAGLRVISIRSENSPILSKFF